jgi:transposase
METTNQTGIKNWREYRRKRAWEMHQQGYKQQAIADALGLTQSGVSHIIRRAKEGGESALDHHSSPGAPRRLQDEQRQQLLLELAKGAEAHGYAGDVWTSERIAQFIEQRFQVKYHPDYIGPLLRQLGWSPQRPIVRASQRDEAVIQEWVTKKWPALKKEQ